MNDLLWTEKYRPQAVEDCILPADLKKTFQHFVDTNFVPNLLLNGGPGVGKTTVAQAMLTQLGCDWIIFNGSLNVDKDTLRTDIQRYASATSLSGGRKYVILDEADYLNANHVQPALRNFMESFSDNCGFILTCNWKNKIIDPLHSRCTVIDFVISGKQKAELAKQFMTRVGKILEEEGVEYDKKVIAEVIMKFFPDWRRVLNELQRYAAASGNKIDTGVLAQIVDADISDLLDALKAKDFGAMRKWIAMNDSLETTALFRRLYDASTDKLKPQSVPALVMILADYQYKSAFVVDHEINTAAAMTQIMMDCEFK